MKRYSYPENNRVYVLWRFLFAGVALLTIMTGGAHAYPGLGANCAGCHSRPDGAFDIVPDVLQIFPGGTGQITFEVTDMPVGGRAALSMVGLDAHSLMATPDLTGWASQSGGAWLTSDLFDTVGTVPFQVTIGAEATPGDYPIDVTLAGRSPDGTLWSTMRSFIVVVIDEPTTNPDIAKGGRPLSATLTGTAEVPGPGDPDGSGEAFVTLNPGLKEVCFQISVFDIAPAKTAHIHWAPEGVAGPVVIGLIPPTDDGFSGIGFSSGCVNADVYLIFDIIKNPSRYYVNVHNDEFPGGAVRGQLSK